VADRKQILSQVSIITEKLDYIRLINKSVVFCYTVLLSVYRLSTTASHCVCLQICLSIQ